jgi:hypothetical protein
MPWDFSRYNVVVKQVEGVSDLLRDVQARIVPMVAEDRIAAGLVQHLSEAIAELDERAIRMLSLYDPAAVVMLENGVKYDPRRDMFGESFRARAARAAAIAAAAVPAARKKKRRRRILRRLLGGEKHSSNCASNSGAPCDCEER